MFVGLRMYSFNDQFSFFQNYICDFSDLKAPTLVDIFKYVCALLIMDVILVIRILPSAPYPKCRGTQTDMTVSKICCDKATNSSTPQEKEAVNK